MNVNLLIFVSSAKYSKSQASRNLVKTYESDFRPAKGDCLDDPGFHPSFHNGYEVARVTINYAKNECWVSLTPLAPEIESISIEEYISHLKAHGWREFKKQEL